MPVESIISSLGSSFLPILEKLTGSGDILHRGATVYQKSCEIEYTYQISIGTSHSRINGIVKRLKGYLSNPVEFDDVAEIYGFGLPHNEDLKKIGIIQVKGKKAIVDFSRIFKEIKSELVTLSIRKTFPEQLNRMIVEPHMVKTSKYIGTDYIETNMEVILDYADLWYSYFDKFKIKEVQFSFGLNVTLDNLVNCIPKSFVHRFTNAAREAQNGNGNASHFLKIASDKFMTFQNDKRTKEMLNAISVTPEQNFKVIDIHPSMQSCEIAGIGYPIPLPGQMKILLEANLEGKEAAINGIIKIDVKKFNIILKNIVREIETATKKLNF